MKVKQDIIEWFEMVCEGIRDEYEQGASHRSLNTDKETLLEMLENDDEN